MKPKDEELFIDAEHPECVITREDAKTYAQQIARTLRDVDGIGAEGPGKDVIAMYSTNQVLSSRFTFSFKMMYPVAMLGVIGAGGVWAPTPFNLTSTEASRHFGIVMPKLVFCSEDLLASTRDACDKAGIPRSKIYLITSSPQDITNGETGKSLLGPSLLPWSRVTDLEQLKQIPIFLHFTSGTTGLPKYLHSVSDL